MNNKIILCQRWKYLLCQRSRKKINYLKDQYRRINSKNKNKASRYGEGKHKRPWVYLKSLMFLDNVVLIKNRLI